MYEEKLEINKLQKPKISNNTFQQTSLHTNYNTPKIPDVKSNLNTTPTIKSNSTLLCNTSTAQKPFKSKYMNDSGKWSQNAVNDGFVEFDDYIGDIQDTTTQYKSFNNKPMKISMPASNNIQYNNKSDILSEYSLKDVEYPSLSYASNSKEVYNYVSEKKDNAVDYVGGKVDTAINFVKGKADTAITKAKDYAKKTIWTAGNFGALTADHARKHGENAEENAEEKSKIWGLGGKVWNNKADAYRHFIWNANMTRDSRIGYYIARNITNHYEYEMMQENNWLSNDSDPFNYMKDNTIIKGKMNQENFMDLWNNQVGRELANNKAFADKSTEELFNFAIDNKLLITDANKVYEFLGITEYASNDSSYSVDVEWNLANGNVTVKKNGKSVTLKIGI